MTFLLGKRFALKYLAKASGNFSLTASHGFTLTRRLPVALTEARTEHYYHWPDDGQQVRLFYPFRTFDH